MEAVEAVEEVESATHERIDGFDHPRLLEPTGNVPPLELEQHYDEYEGALATTAGLD